METQARKLARSGYMTAREAADLIGRHVTSVYRMVQAGTVDGLHIGRSWYVQRDSLARYLGPAAARALGLG